MPITATLKKRGGIIRNLTRKVSILMRFTEAERDRIHEKMAYAGVRNREEFMRQAILNGYNIKVDSSEIREFSRLLGTIASNVNQIVRRANETRSIYESDLADLKDFCGRALELARESLKVQQGQADKIKAVLKEIQ
jgi:hypothetical protein